MKPSPFPAILLAVLAGLWGTPTVMSQTSSDQQFLIDAADNGFAEVQLGKLAREHGSAKAVREFAQEIVTDHTEANKGLQNVIVTKGVTFPTKLNKKYQALYDKLAKMRGRDFDSEYMRQMVADHVTTVGRFEVESDRGRDVDVRTWATKTLPTLQRHLETARGLAQQTKQDVGP
jgi:putative membrane protein